MLPGSCINNNINAVKLLLLPLPQDTSHLALTVVVVATTEVPQGHVITTPLVVAEDVVTAANDVTTGDVASVSAVVVVTTDTDVATTTGTDLNNNSSVVTASGKGQALWLPSRLLLQSGSRLQKRLEIGLQLQGLALRTLAKASP